MVFLRNEVSLTYKSSAINTHLYEVSERSEVRQQELSGTHRNCKRVFTCWMRTSFSSLTTLVSSSIWFDSCFVLTPKRKGLLFCLTGAEEPVLNWLLCSYHCDCFPGIICPCGSLPPHMDSYPEFEPSPFVGNGSLVMKQHSQKCLQPPAWARLRSPVWIKQVKVDDAAV